MNGIKSYNNFGDLLEDSGIPMKLAGHINPNCKDSRYCLPHSEMGEVRYDINKMLKQLKKKTV
jgi:hypothetical protein